MIDTELLEALKVVLKELQITIEDFADGSFDNEQKEQIAKVTGSLDRVFDDRTIGGGDYDGWEVVYHFKEHNIFISVRGSYHSEYGCDFSYSDLTIVEPVEVTTTEYHQKKVKKKS